MTHPLDTITRITPILARVRAEVFSPAVSGYVRSIQPAARGSRGIAGDIGGWRGDVCRATSLT
jgi:hypothetical protein